MLKLMSENIYNFNENCCLSKPVVEAQITDLPCHQLGYTNILTFICIVSTMKGDAILKAKLVIKSP